MNFKEKILIIRFSSFGDVTQSLSIPSALITQFPDAEIHWLTRQDLSPLLEGHPHIHKIVPFNRKSGFLGLVELGLKLRKQKFTRIYDAHNNLRSRVITFLLSPLWCITNFLKITPIVLRRPIYRVKRFLLFKFRINKFEMPFSGQRDLLNPLKKWGISNKLPATPQIFANKNAVSSVKTKVNFSNFITIAPSAAHILKRWPLDYWRKLMNSLPNENFVILGGAEDHFLHDLCDPKNTPKNILNLAGKTNYQESVAVVQMSKLLITNDTGVLHIGEQLGKKTIALMGPAPFGFPSRPSTKILEINLSCRPCSKHGQGPCVNQVFQRCLVDIKPEIVLDEIHKLM